MTFEIGDYVQLKSGTLPSVIWKILALHPELHPEPTMAQVEVYYNPEKLKVVDLRIQEIMGGHFLRLKHLEPANPMLVIALEAQG